MIPFPPEAAAPQRLGPVPESRSVPPCPDRLKGSNRIDFARWNARFKAQHGGCPICGSLDPEFCPLASCPEKGRA